MAKILEFQLQYQSFQWIFRIDWFDLLAVQGTPKTLLQHHSSQASIVWHSAFFDGQGGVACCGSWGHKESDTTERLNWTAFFIVQLSHPYMITGKIIALTRQTFVGKVMSLLFNVLSRLVIAFLPRSKESFMHFSFDPVIPLIGIYPEGTCPTTWKYICTVLLVIALEVPNTGYYLNAHTQKRGWINYDISTHRVLCSCEKRIKIFMKWYGVTFRTYC